MDEPWEVPREEARAGYEAAAGTDYMREWNKTVPWMGGMTPVALVGFALVLMAGLLFQIWQTTGADGDGLVDTATWFAWAGRALVAAAFILAAIRASASSTPVRLVLLALGTLVLLGTTPGQSLLALGL